MFVDREKATSDINYLLNERRTSWIVLSGGRKIGKTEFAKNVVALNGSSIYCNPGVETVYASAFANALAFPHDMRIETVVCEFSKRDAAARNIFKSLGLQYISRLNEVQLRSVIKQLIKTDILSGLYSFAHYLGEVYESNIKCIVLDDFHNCDYDSYSWILEMWFAITTPKPTMIVVCNFELDWESAKLYNTFHGVEAPVSIESFDSEIAFYDILGEYFEFENDINLSTVSSRLFALFEGSSQLLFETIKLLKGKINSYTDKEKMTQITSMAQQVRLRCFKELNKSHMLVMRLLAYSPVPITKGCIRDILEWNDLLVTEIITKLYESNFVKQTADKETGNTLYSISDDFLIDLIKNGCTGSEQLFYKTKISRAIKYGQIFVSLEQMVTLAIELNESEAEELLVRYMTEPNYEIPAEKKASYIDKFINQMSRVPELLVSIHTVQLLYMYGYYQTAQKVIGCLQTTSRFHSYNNLLLLGDIQHILLSPKASQTYKIASEIEGITISDKLKALNRQIMALNQEHQETVAQKLYIEAFLEYESVPCTGLVELYRNSNNSFGYIESMDYTIKGYRLAKELGDELEMNKCLHNICMLRLQYGQYGQPLKNNVLGFEPHFEQVLSYFSKHCEYRHEQAYPLLDLGTVKMFEYIESNDLDRLYAAKKYYSKAQLYAKSFYARHIAETGLLVVNSYLYSDRQASFVNGLRDNLYKRYTQQKASIEDYRVHRKILLSLAVSAIISTEITEAVAFLGEAYPYVFGAETNRYNNLCHKAGCKEYIKPAVSLAGKFETYYASDRFVPWLISFCH